jgi:two-component system, NtrC family, nitrogen regulation response regulator NtrX
VTKRVLIIDDELARIDQVQHFRKEYGIAGVDFEFCKSLERAIEKEYWTYDLLLLDIRFEGQGDDRGIYFLRKIKKDNPRIPVVMLSAVRDPEVLIQCWDFGAQGYIIKWAFNDNFRRELKQKIDTFSLQKKTDTIIGRSADVQKLKDFIENIAPWDASVLITGDTGTGKDLAAKAIHNKSRRVKGPFVAVNCSAVPNTLFEKAFFGAKMGAYTGASENTIGYFKAAHGGTLFLDEIGEMCLENQSKLLQVLDHNEFIRLGDTNAEEVNVRIISATNIDLSQAIEKRTFRLDLYHRITESTIHVPSLNKRLEDIPDLSVHFLRLFQSKNPGMTIPSSFSAHCITALQLYDWPGNIRELKNVVEDAARRAIGDVIQLEDLRDHISKRLSHRLPLVTSHPNELSNLDLSRQDKARLVGELNLCLLVKKEIKRYKKDRWKAEFMRTLYPSCKAQNAKGFDDLIRRLTKSPWGDENWEEDLDLKALIEELKEE